MLTGPDHLSALATLSANVNISQAFFLGIRWGIGHSTGLLVVGVFFIAISLGDKSAETVDVPDGVSKFFESLVGIFMISLGIYGMIRAWDRRPKASYGSIMQDVDGILQEEALEEASVEIANQLPSYHDHSGLHGIGSTGGVQSISDENTSTSDDESSTSCFRAVSSKSLAILAGIIHGLAGPGGVLGVIPAVQLHNARLATVYLATFCASSTLTMGCFATLYGSCSSRLASSRGRYREFVVECASASLSLIVGVTWLVLLSVGKLEDVFP